MTYEEGEALAKENKFLFQEASAKTGENVSTLFNKEIADQIVQRFFEKKEEQEEDSNNINEIGSLYY